MKWINGETYISKKIRLEKWHKWFAWYPITINHIDCEDGKIRNVKIWLETVMRKGTSHCCEGLSCWSYEYKEVK